MNRPDTEALYVTLDEVKYLSMRLLQTDPQGLSNTSKSLVARLKWIRQQLEEQRDKRLELEARARSSGHVAPVEDREVEEERRAAREARKQKRRQQVLEKVASLPYDQREAIIKQLRGHV